MNDTYPVAHAPSPMALFRYAVIAQVEAIVLAGRSVSRAVRLVAAREHVHPARRPVRVSVRTIQRWWAAYQQSELAGLEPKSRQRTTTSEALPAELVLFFKNEKRSDPRASIPELIRRARVRGVIRQDLPVDRSTAWRACVRMALPTRYRPSKRELDSRRWRYPHRMQCVLCDGKHFRAGPQQLRRVALFFLDDATRYALGVRVGTAESTVSFRQRCQRPKNRHETIDWDDATASDNAGRWRQWQPWMRWAGQRPPIEASLVTPMGFAERAG